MQNNAAAKITPRQKISNFFNWLSQPPKRNYTLGEAYQHFAQKKPYAEINDNLLGYTNAGRLTERLHTLAGAASAALVVASAPLSLPTTFLVAGGFIGLYKVMGLAAGKLADSAVSGSFRSAPPKKQPANSPGK